jgi:hypothetical protein
LAFVGENSGLDFFAVFIAVFIAVLMADFIADTRTADLGR